MKQLLLIVLSALATLPACAESARKTLAQGIEAYQSTNFAKASELFIQAGKQAADEKLDPCVAWFDQGNTLYQQKEIAKALEAYQKALPTTDLNLQAKTFHNIGTSYVMLALQEIKEGKGKEMKQHLALAQTAFESAMSLAPDDEDPKVNYELALDMEQRILYAVTLARSAYEHAMSLVNQYDYQKAYDFLGQEIPKHQMAFVMDEKLKENMTGAQQKSGEVLGILKAPPPVEGGAPQAPAATAPALPVKQP